jgi:hypothetical protein
VPLDDEVQPDLEDDVVRRARVRVGQRVARGGELLEEPPRHGDVEPRELRRERLHVGPLRPSRWRRDHIRDEELARSRFFRKNRTVRDPDCLFPSTRPGGDACQHLRDDVTARRSDRRRRELERRLRIPQRRHDRPHRRREVRLQLGHDLPRLALRGPEEPRHDVGGVLRRDDVRHLDERREVQASIPQRLHDLRVLLDLLRRGLAVVRGPLRQPELAGEKVEQRAVPELAPPPLPVEDREGDEELREGVVLAAEEVGEVAGLFAGGRHGADPLMRFRASLERTRMRPDAISPHPPRDPSGVFAARERGPRRRRAGPPGAVTERQARFEREAVKHSGGARHRAGYAQ